MILLFIGLGLLFAFIAYFPAPSPTVSFIISIGCLSVAALLSIFGVN